MRRRHFLALAAAASIAAARTSEATTTSMKDIESAIASGAPVLIHVTAPWCGTCKVQKPIVADLLATPELSGLKKFDVDYDSQRDVLSHFRVRNQATMVVFKGGKEVDRRVGETNRQKLAAFFKQVI